MKKPKIGPYELEKLEAKFTRQSVSKSVDNNFTLYNNKCVVRRVVDGDTIDVDIDLGHDVWIRNKRVRLVGIDTPESRTRNKEEKKYGLLAKHFVTEFIPVGSKCILRTKEKGKYGRYLGDFKVGRKWLCAELLKNYHAVKYHGQSKKDIAAAHLLNRSKVRS